MKKTTHILAVTLAAIAGFFSSPAGAAVLRQYPRLAIVASLVAAILTLYHQPAKPSAP